MGKHAYLIMAHKDDFTFRTLLRLLDHERNVLFVHMDRKVSNYDPLAIKKLISKSELIHTPERRDIQWGGDSQIFLELMLLEMATSFGKFDYYHLISGEDLPIKSQAQIHGFFDDHAGDLFIQVLEGNYDYRVRCYHTFQDKIGKNRSLLSRFNGLYLKTQMLLCIHRNKDVSFIKGANWFSITDEFARYVLSQKTWIRHVFHSTYCADELFLQTVLAGSDFMKYLYRPETGFNPIVRHIKWSEDTLSPYIFRITDRDELTDSKQMFARKFDCQIDIDIINYIASNLVV